MTQTPSTAPSLTRYAYEPRTRRYRDNGTGRFVSPVEIRKAVDILIDTETQNIRSLTTSLTQGKISLAEWQVQTAALLKSMHVAVGLAANGGLQNTSTADLGYLASQVKGQYQYLRTFVQQIKQGKQPLDGTLVARAGLYGQAARGTYSTMVQRLARNGGATLSRSVLGLADHCEGCLSEAKRGWVPIGENIPIGQRTCLANCHCELLFK
jgi:hypothetical protein